MPKTSSISSQVLGYLLSKPLLLYYLQQGIVNTSALARKIKKELGIKKSVEAVVMALHRLNISLYSSKTPNPSKLLEKSEISIRTGYSVVVSSLPIQCEAEATISLGKHFLYILPSSKAQRCKHKKGLVFFRDHLLLVEFIHPIEVEDTPGVVFHILAKFYESNISIAELVSSWDRTFLLVDESEAERILAYLLKNKVSQSSRDNKQE